MRIVGLVALWLITLFLAFVFFKQGLNKFPAHNGWAVAFAHWHFPIWFRWLIGVIEVASALLLIWPRTATIGALMIIVVMLGGVATHVWWHHPEQSFHEAMPLVLGTIIATARRRASIVPLALRP